MAGAIECMHSEAEPRNEVARGFSDSERGLFLISTLISSEARPPFDARDGRAE
jgi:hypothetical protein